MNCFRSTQQHNGTCLENHECGSMLDNKPEAKATKQLFEPFKPSNVTTKFRYLWKAPPKMAILLVFLKRTCHKYMNLCAGAFCNRGRIFFKW
jgi:hypothetical protein